jgi:hypothetical protein
MKKLSSEDRATLIRLASSLPKGSPEKKAILAGLSKTATPSWRERPATEDEFVLRLRKSLEQFAKSSRGDIEDWADSNNYFMYDPDAAWDSASRAQAIRMFNEGWSLSDAYRFLSSTEEVDPRIPESRALRTMNMLQKKYR